MNKTLQKECNKYIKSIKKELTCDYSLKRVYILELKERINDLVDTNPNISILEIENQFGSAQIIANSFNANITEHLKKKAKRYKYIMTLLVIFFILLVFISIILIGLLIGYGDTAIITEPQIM